MKATKEQLQQISDEVFNEMFPEECGDDEMIRSMTFATLNIIRKFMEKYQELEK